MEQHLVVAIAASKLPRSLEELKKLADHAAICGLGIDTYHYLKSLAERGNRFLMDTEPFFKEDQAEQNLVVVLPP